MRVIMGSDHGGFELKEQIKKHLSTKGIDLEDIGTSDSNSVDYPDFAQRVAKKVQKRTSFGILICGTGIGVCITANKFKGIRAALCFNEYTAKMSREHNDANILCMGGRTTDIKTAKIIVDTFLDTPKSREERHKARVEKIKEIEKNNFK